VIYLIPYFYNPINRFAYSEIIKEKNAMEKYIQAIEKICANNID
jgi:hypothetical protein